MTTRLGILTAVIVALVAGGLALGFGLMSNSMAIATKAEPAAHTTTTTTNHGRRQQSRRRQLRRPRSHPRRRWRPHRWLPRRPRCHPHRR